MVKHLMKLLFCLLPATVPAACLLVRQHNQLLRRTCVAVAGQDYCVVAASTRMSTGFSILKRDSSLFLQLCAWSRSICSCLLDPQL